ncbi:phospholipase D-like domain-containing protein [Winogradskyella vidalii]|uniref:phospholipase D-like domain-containing protein n=1 Tax=Winogradskyella vidalii TaxID=2615024 RepID=UPI0015CE7ED9|nr:phospholipase D-like domain-containing protein [Winogradskyella vidalii]
MKQSLLKGKAIFENLASSLNAAKSSIYVVSAWFTDPNLLELLILKAKENIEVSVVIGDNKDNLKLDFSELEALGGTLTRIKGKGYGIMHQKYCIIDKKTAFHGSYNWTVNARKNNSESVIKTNLKSIIEELLNDFKSLTMEQETLESKEEKTPHTWLSKFKNKLKKTAAIEQPQNAATSTTETPTKTLSVDDIFKSIISAEIKKTNRNEIKEKAYDQAKEVSGDYQVITNFMDSLYHLFVSDKKENDINKENLLNKIDHRVAEFTQNITSEKDEIINSIHIENQAEEKKIAFQKTDLLGKKEQKETEKKNILETTITEIEKKISNLKDKLTDLNIEFVKPMFKYHEFIPLLLFFLGLSVALFLFYSSSAYIMLYSYEDALEAASAGISVNPQVYEAKALSKALAKGGTALSYILFFVFIPFTIAYIAHSKTENDISNKKRTLSAILIPLISYTIVILIDVFIAIKVSTTISEINYLSKGIAPDNSVTGILSDINFWLVFFLGAIPFFFLAIIMNKLIQFLAERNTQSGRERMLVEKKVLSAKIEALEQEISTHNNKANSIGLEIEKLECDLNQLEQALIYLPKDLDTKITQANQKANNNIADIRKKADVYKNDIENDNIQISLSSLKDRVSAFIEGWNEWLHDEYAIDKAVSMSQEAIEACDQWMEVNMKKIEA